MSGSLGSGISKESTQKALQILARIIARAEVEERFDVKEVFESDFGSTDTGPDK